ncbi:prepilin-type N-terminal cleavage/methylation domain-containing protein [bacterium]|nr:prepilin-type N-terminal cleavage/methylation domain-containing protein [bacterium]
MRQSRRGHTLLETLIASALIGICLMGVWSLVRAGSRYLLITNAKVELQNGAIRTLRLIAEQFSETNDRSFYCGNSTVQPLNNGQVNHGVVFVSPRDPVTGEIEHDLKGRILWSKYVAFYHYEETPGNFCVARSSTNMATKWPYPVRPPYLDPYLQTNPDRKILARNVALFECEQYPANLKVRMLCQLSSGWGKKYGFEVETMVYTRN